MTDEIAQAPAPAEALPDTAAIPDKPVETATPPEAKPEPKKSPEQSRSDAVRKAVDKAFEGEDEAKPAEKAAEPPKSAPKPEPSDSETGEDAPAQPDEAQKASEAKKADPAAQHRNDNVPDKIAPHVRDQWKNVPKDVKADLHRVFEAQAKEAEQFREDRQFRESMREYDELAKKAGTTVDKAMARYVDVDRRLNSPDDNTRARTMLELMQSSRVDPVQFAEAILQNREHFKGQAQQRPDPMVAQMSQQLQQLTAKLQEQEQAQRAAPVMQTVQEFAQSKPDYAELENDIAEILQTGIIQRRYPGLSADQMLAEAYRRAGGSHPSQSDIPAAAASPDEPPEPRQANPAGRKSVSGAPQGDPRTTPKKLTRSAAVEKAMRDAGL